MWKELGKYAFDIVGRCAIFAGMVFLAEKFGSKKYTNNDNTDYQDQFDWFDEDRRREEEEERRRRRDEEEEERRRRDEERRRRNDDDDYYYRR